MNTGAAIERQLFIFWLRISRTKKLKHGKNNKKWFN
jgi:hypothetical protein